MTCTGEATGEIMKVQREEYASAAPVPDVEMEDGGQPEEEAAESTDPNHEIHIAARERAMNFLITLETNDHVLTFCVVCGDPRHTLVDCKFDEKSIVEST